jgi:hypothetical protein
MIPLLPRRLRAVLAGRQSAADPCERDGPLALSADWLRLARLARVLSWLTLAWLGIEGGPGRFHDCPRWYDGGILRLSRRGA